MKIACDSNPYAGLEDGLHKIPNIEFVSGLEDGPLFSLLSKNGGSCKALRIPKRDFCSKRVSRSSSFVPSRECRRCFMGLEDGPWMQDLEMACIKFETAPDSNPSSGASEA